MKNFKTKETDMLLHVAEFAAMRQNGSTKLADIEAKWQTLLEEVRDYMTDRYLNAWLDDNVEDECILPLLHDFTDSDDKCSEIIEALIDFQKNEANTK